MGVLRPQHKRERYSQECDLTARRQTVGFGLGQIDDQRNIGTQGERGAQKANAARLDQTLQNFGGPGGQPAGFGAHLSLVIRDEVDTIGHQLQRER